MNSLRNILSTVLKAAFGTCEKIPVDQYGSVTSMALGDTATHHYRQEALEQRSISYCTDVHLLLSGITPDTSYY